MIDLAKADERVLMMKGWQSESDLHFNSHEHLEIPHKQKQPACWKFSGEKPFDVQANLPRWKSEYSERDGKRIRWEIRKEVEVGCRCLVDSKQIYFLWDVAQSKTVRDYQMNLHW